MALDMQDAEDRYKLEPVDALTPEKVFAARWAMALLGEAMNRLRQQYAIGHNVAMFETLKAFLDVGNGKEPPTYEQAAAALQASVGAVKTLIHRLRKQYTASVREEIGRTVSNPAEVDAEIHELCEALMVKGVQQRLPDLVGIFSSQFATFAQEVLKAKNHDAVTPSIFLLVRAGYELVGSSTRS